LKATHFSKYTEIPINIEMPKNSMFGDYSSVVAMHIAQEVGVPADRIAKEIIAQIDLSQSYIEKVELKNGFINFSLKKECLAKFLHQIELIDFQGRKTEFSDTEDFFDIEYAYAVICRILTVNSGSYKHEPDMSMKEEEEIFAKIIINYPNSQEEKFVLAYLKNVMAGFLNYSSKCKINTTVNLLWKEPSEIRYFLLNKAALSMKNMVLLLGREFEDSGVLRKNFSN